MRKRADNRGLTLVELVVSIAIMAIVGSAILSFFLFSTRQYHKGNSETTVQSEAQMVVGRLENMIMNASDGVGTNATGDVLYLFSHEIQSIGGVDTTICRRTMIALDNDKHQLQSNYQEWSMDSEGRLTPDPSGGVEPPVSTPIVIADYMDTVGACATPVFNVNLSKLATEQTVTVTISIKLREQSYSTTNQFVLRNRVSCSTTDSLEEHFKLENIKE